VTLENDGDGRVRSRIAGDAIASLSYTPATRVIASFPAVDADVGDESYLLLGSGS
jgi:hypothetical protein